MSEPKKRGKPGPRHEKMWRGQIRLPHDVVQRVEWVAAERGGALSETIRQILAAATKDARPPERRSERVIAATDQEWESWADAARECGVSLDDLIKATMNRVVKQVFEP